MYGGGFAGNATNILREDIASRIDSRTPPMFIAHAFDDDALNSIALMNALKRANVAAELHIFAAGAHGFGVRDSGLPIAPWRDLCLGWMRWQGYLDVPAVRTFARDFNRWRERATGPAPRFTSFLPSADLAEAFAAQRRIVREAVRGGAEIAGYKAAFTTAAAQRAAGVMTPVHGVLFKAGKVAASAALPATIRPTQPILVETEIGYVIATDIATKLRVPRQALTTVEAIVPVIELPMSPGPLSAGALAVDARDAVAGNVGSNQFIVGAAVSPKNVAQPDAVAVSLSRDGRSLHETSGADVKDGQAQNLMTLINQIVEQGRVIHRGDILISGALGGAKPGEKGNYTADFGPLGVIAFRIE
jgi:2-oxo-3-hexenedioate decarboxylase